MVIKVTGFLKPLATKLFKRTKMIYAFLNILISKCDVLLLLT